jgi:hypothetical protein
MPPLETYKLPTVVAAALLLQACAEEPRPPSVDELLDNPIKLEAIMVRCSQNRSESRYEPDCVSARQAVAIIEAREERARRDALELQSERKREALRRTQEAVAEARRRAEAAERQREEAEYLAQFGELPPPPEDEPTSTLEANMPGAELPKAEVETRPAPVVQESAPRPDGSNAPVAEAPPASDLDAVRDELKRRSEQQTQ